METTVEVESKREADLITAALSDPPIRAFVQVVGALLPLSKRERQQVAIYVETAVLVANKLAEGQDTEEKVMDTVSNTAAASVEGEATPRPWHVNTPADRAREEDGGIDWDEDYPRDVAIRARWEVCRMSGVNDHTLADAELIVCAVNSHDANLKKIETLVAQLGIAARDCESMANGEWDGYDHKRAAAEMAKYLRAALVLAQETK